MNIASFTGAYMFSFVVIVITFSLFLFIQANCVFLICQALFLSLCYPGLFFCGSSAERSLVFSMEFSYSAGTWCMNFRTLDVSMLWVLCEMQPSS